MSHDLGGENKKTRRTIAEQASDINIRDPAQHTRHQVSELDKQAKGGLAKRKFRLEQIDHDTKEIAQIDDEIFRIKQRYDPLCKSLEERRQKRKELMATLESCLKEEKRIMGETIQTVGQKKIDEMKLSRSFCSLEMAIQRGYTVTPESTFYQSRDRHNKLGTLNMSLAPPGSGSAQFTGTGGKTLPLVASSLLTGKR